MVDRPITIYEARTIPEAQALNERLAEAGISAAVSSELATGMGASDVWGLPRPIRVAVDQQDAEAARRIALQFDESVAARALGTPETTGASEQRAGGGQGESASALAPEAGGASVEDIWPRCPECGAPRLMKCRYCGTAGTGFRLADQVEDEPAGQQAGRLVICPTCDEAMAPAYLQACEWCGHRFADGVAPPRDAFGTEWTWRLVIAVIALVAIVAALILYFSSLL